MSTIPQARKLFDSLSHADKAALIVALYNGAPQFDPSARTDAELSYIVGSWLDGGSVPADAIALAAARAHAAEVARSVPPAPIAPPPSVAPAPMPSVLTADEHAEITRQALASQQALVAAPRSPQPSVRAAVSAALDALAETPDEPQPAPVARPIAAAVLSPQPVALSDVAMPRTRSRVAARSLFADQPSAVVDRIPASLTIDYYAHADVPAIDPDYAFDGRNLAATLGALACSPCLNLWLGGPRGTGKTEFARQIAARTGRPFFRVNFNRSTDAEDILGGQGLRAGETLTIPGPVAIAARTEGALCLLDELTYAVAAHSAALNPILERDGATARVPRTGEKLIVAAGVCFIVADNTMGSGATSNEYTGRSPLGSDTLDRFGKFLAFDYLDAATERRVLRAMVARACGLRPSSDMAKAVCKIVAVTRAKADAGELEGAPSLRRAVAFCVALVQGFEPSDAYVDCIVNPAPQDSQEALRQIFAATWDHGNAQPAQSNAGNPFADPSAV